MANPVISLTTFSQQLSQQLAHIRQPRPFVCDGNPLTCEVFIVGFNAATDMQAPFWQFWHNEQGFDRATWFATYVKERAEKPLKPGKTRRLAVSRTRACIELIVRELAPWRCLETNLYMTATASANELAAAQMDSSTFDFLLAAIRPKLVLVLVHGTEARQHLQQLAGCLLQPNTATPVVLHNCQVIVMPISHLSRGWSNARCTGLGQQLAGLLADSQ